MQAVPLHSSVQHLSCDNCREDKREDYQNCSVPYCTIVVHSADTYEQLLKLTVDHGRPM